MTTRWFIEFSILYLHKGSAISLLLPFSIAVIKHQIVHHALDLSATSIFTSSICALSAKSNGVAGIGYDSQRKDAKNGFLNCGGVNRRYQVSFENLFQLYSKSCLVTSVRTKKGHRSKPVFNGWKLLSGTISKQARRTRESGCAGQSELS